MAGNERKRKHQKPKGPPKPQTVGASHRDKDINQWEENDMRMCLDEYKRQLAVANNITALVKRAQIVKSFGISPSTLYHRVSTTKSSHHVEGWHHASGGKRHPCMLIKGKHTLFQVLLHLILAACKGVTQNQLVTYLYHFQVMLTCDHFDHPKSVYTFFS